MAFILSTASEGKSLGGDKGSSRQKSSAARNSSSGASFHFPSMYCFGFQVVKFGRLGEDLALTEISGAGAHSGGASLPAWLLLQECDALVDEEAV